VSRDSGSPRGRRQPMSQLAEAAQAIRSRPRRFAWYRLSRIVSTTGCPARPFDAPEMIDIDHPHTETLTCPGAPCRAQLHILSSPRLLKARVRASIFEELRSADLYQRRTRRSSNASAWMRQEPTGHGSDRWPTRVVHTARLLRTLN
jgi:hypothetical protein